MFIGTALGSTDVHAHYAHQVTVSATPGLRLRAEEGAPWEAYEAAFVPSGAPHALDVRGVGAWAVVFVGPETWVGRALAARFATAGPSGIAKGDFRGADERLFQAWRGGDSTAVAAAGEAFVDEFVGETHSVDVLDERVARALELIGRGAPGSPTLTATAREVHLSPSRLRHLLTEQTGAGFRAHVRWRRLLRAWTLVRAGASLTEAAHEAGFSDSAHLSRSVRRTFGLTPSTISDAMNAADPYTD